MAEQTDDPFEQNEPAPDESKKATPPKDPETGRFVSPKPKHSPYWLRRAEQVSLSADDANELDADELKDEVRHRENQIYFHQHSLRRETQDSRAESPSAPPAPVEPEFKLPDVLDPEIAAVIRAQHEEIKALKGQVGGISQREQARQGQELTQFVDSVFASLGPEYESFIGKGGHDDVQGTVQHERRGDILAAARIDWSKDTRAEAKKKIVAAAKRLHVAPTKSAYEEPTEREREFVENTVERPTHRRVPELKPGVDKAKATFDKLASAYEAKNGTSGGEDYFT